MITLTREEAQQVLDALTAKSILASKLNQAIELLRARLSAPEPEPVAGYRWEEGRTPPSVTFTSPPQREWIGLTVDEFYDLDDVGRKMILEYGRLVEAKLREKNT